MNKVKSSCLGYYKRGEAGNLCYNRKKKFRNNLHEWCICKENKRGDKVIVAGFELSEKKIKPKIIFVDENNKLLEEK